MATVAMVVVAVGSWGATSLDGGSGTLATRAPSSEPRPDTVPGASSTTAPAAPTPTTVVPTVTPATVPDVSVGARTTVRSSPASSLSGTGPAVVPASGATTVPPQASISYASTAPAPPSADLPATPDLTLACRGGAGGSPSCLSVALQAFDNARAAEGIVPLTLPDDFESLTAGQQLLVLVDSERVDRGLTPVDGELDALDGLAATGAEDDTDPSFPSGGLEGVTAWAWAGNWASAGSVLSAVYEWMYDDGPGSGNIDCTTADPGGCWDHRDNILGFQNDIDAFGGSIAFGGAVEPGSARGPSAMSVTTLMTWSPDAPSGYTYTWADAVAAGAS